MRIILDDQPVPSSAATLSEALRAGAEDVGAALTWVKNHAAEFGGRILSFTELGGR